MDRVNVPPDPSSCVASRSDAHIMGRSHPAAAHDLVRVRRGQPPHAHRGTAAVDEARPPPTAHRSGRWVAPSARSATQSTTTNRRRALMCNP